MPATNLFCLGSAAALTTWGGEANQSALAPAGPGAAKIAVLWWVMLAAFSAVFVLVLVLLVIAIFRRPPLSSLSFSDGETGDGPTPPLGRTGFVIAGGIGLPIVVLVPLLVYSLEISRSLRPPPEAFTVQVRGFQWWWEIRYPEHGIITANEIHIPAGRPVRLELSSADVIHSFWVPSLHGKRDMIPGQVTSFWIQADEAGVYRGQCAEYCGRQHANMAFLVVALPPNEYPGWVAGRQAEQEARRSTTGAEVPRGLQVFRAAGCATCHTIQGVPGATGQAGPDLTHLGSRRTLGAGILANNRGNLAGWVANPQPLKPGIKMPPTYLGSEDLLALVAYLEGLK